MFGPSIKTVFRSRWHALLWSAGILATAYCSVPAADQGGNDAAQAAKAAAEAAHKAKHRNPWS